MCDLCQLISDGLDGGLFLSIVPPCDKGRALAIAHNIQITRLQLFPRPDRPALDRTRRGAFSSDLKEEPL
jgi:hypothetical protein